MRASLFFAVFVFVGWSRKRTFTKEFLGCEKMAILWSSCFISLKKLNNIFIICTFADIIGYLFV